MAAKKPPWSVRRLSYTNALTPTSAFPWYGPPAIVPDARWDDPRKTLLCCHFFRLARTNDVFAQVRLQFLFTSRAFIYMVRISWERQPMLLFSDIHRDEPVSFRRFHEDRSLGKHNIQMGLPEGHSVLLHFSNNGRAYQAVLVSMSSAPSKSKKGEHAMWKHVLPVSTDFAWLPGTLQMPSALLPCTKIQLDHMAPFMRCNWASMNTTRLCYTLKGYTTLEKLAVLTNLTFSAKCPRRGFA